MALLDTCDKCLEVVIPQCTAYLTVSGLVANTDLNAWFETFDNQFEQLTGTTDSEGSIMLDLSQLPDGYFQTWPWVNLTFSTGNLNCETEDITINTVVYNCITLKSVVCSVLAYSYVSIPC